MRPVLRESEIRSFESSWMARGVDALLLMENAGRGAAHLIGLHLKPRAEKPVKSTTTRGSCVRCADEGNLLGSAAVVVAGPGNNGGDAFVVARQLAMRGTRVIVFEIRPKTTRSREAESARSAFEALGEPVRPFSLDEFTDEARRANVVVDGLFGIGTKGELSDEARRVVEAMNGVGLPIYALDVPSGLDADTGEARGAVVVAAHTVTFGHLKRGLLTPSGQRFAGRITLSHIGVPSTLEREPGVFLVEASDLKPLLVPRDPSGHKSSAGRVAIVGGSTGFEGAARLAGLASLRGGAGISTLVVDRDAAPVARSLALDLMTLAYQTVSEFRELELEKRFDAIIVGPGLGLSDTNEHIVEAALELEMPMVMDADALRIVGKNGPRPLGKGRILTPHPGEAAALLGTSTSEVERDRFSAIERLSDLYGATVVLKGSRPLVRAPGETTRVFALGSPSLSVAGSGDVLAGLLGAELAKSTDRSDFDVATLAVGIHALAGASFEFERGDSGLLASELIERLVVAKRELLASTD